MTSLHLYIQDKEGRQRDRHKFLLSRFTFMLLSNKIPRCERVAGNHLASPCVCVWGFKRRSRKPTKQKQHSSLHLNRTKQNKPIHRHLTMYRLATRNVVVCFPRSWRSLSSPFLHSPPPSTYISFFPSRFLRYYSLSPLALFILFSLCSYDSVSLWRNNFG